MWRKILDPSSRTTKSLFFSRSAHFGNVSPFLVGATNTFSELIHPLAKLLNCVLKQQPHILQFIRSARLFQLSPSSRSRHRLCCRTATSTIYTTFHREATLKTALELVDYSVKIRSKVQTITRAILPRNQSPSVSNSQRGRSCEQIFDSSTTFLNPLVGTNSLYGKQTVVFFSSRLVGRVRLARFASVRLLHHALLISLLIFRKKTDCFSVYFRREVLDILDQGP